MHVDDFMKFGQPVQNMHWEGLSVCNCYKNTTAYGVVLCCAWMFRLSLPNHSKVLGGWLLMCLHTVCSKYVCSYRTSEVCYVCCCWDFVADDLFIGMMLAVGHC